MNARIYGILSFPLYFLKSALSCVDPLYQRYLTEWLQGDAKTKISLQLSVLSETFVVLEIGLLVSRIQLHFYIHVLGIFFYPLNVHGGLLLLESCLGYCLACDWQK